MGYFFLKNWYLYGSTFKFCGGTSLLQTKLEYPPGPGSGNYASTSVTQCADGFDPSPSPVGQSPSPSPTKLRVSPDLSPDSAWAHESNNRKVLYFNPTFNHFC